MLLNQPNINPNVSISDPMDSDNNPPRIKLRCHECELEYMQCPYLFGGYGCDVCGEGGNGMVYHCANHQFDAHPECAKREATSSITEGITPLACAMNNKFKDIVKLLLAHPSIDKTQVIFVACSSGDDDSLRMLLSSSCSSINDCDTEDNSPLMIAAKAGHEKCVKLLLDYPDIELMTLNEDGESACSLACREGNNMYMLIIIVILIFIHTIRSLRMSQGNCSSPKHSVKRITEWKWANSFTSSNCD